MRTRVGRFWFEGPWDYTPYGLRYVQPEPGVFAVLCRSEQGLRLLCSGAAENLRQALETSPAAPEWAGCAKRRSAMIQTIRISHPAAIFFLLPLAVLTIVCGCNDDLPEDTISHTVLMQDNRFNPDSLMIGSGDLLLFVNKDSRVHTSTSGVPGAADGNWDSGAIPSGSSFRLVCNQTGYFNFFCRYNGQDGMSGKVIIRMRRQGDLPGRINLIE